MSLILVPKTNISLDIYSTDLFDTVNNCHQDGENIIFLLLKNKFLITGKIETGTLIVIIYKKN